MKVIIAGGSGLLGSALVAALSDSHHEVVVLTRRSGTAGAAGMPPLAAGVRNVQWTPDGEAAAWTSALEGADAVVNLAGESIGAGRWSATRKRQIVDSRVLATRSLVKAIAASSTPPPVFISGSAVGYYGPCGDEVVTEESPAGADFLAQVCATWEAEARRLACRGPGPYEAGRHERSNSRRARLPLPTWRKPARESLRPQATPP